MNRLAFGSGATSDDLRRFVEADYGKRSSHVWIIYVDCANADQPQYTQGPNLLVPM